jgi:hypothetical protein
MIRRGCYILTNALTDLEETVLDWSEREAAQMGITLAILGLIFMSNGKVGYLLVTWRVVSGPPRRRVEDTSGLCSGLPFAPVVSTGYLDGLST